MDINLNSGFDDLCVKDGRDGGEESDVPRRSYSGDAGAKQQQRRGPHIVSVK